MPRQVPNFQLERIEDDVVRESFQKIQQFWASDSEGLTGIIKQLIFENPTPWLTWGRSGANAPGTYLLNNDVVSSVSGRIAPSGFPNITAIAISQGTAVSSQFTLVEHSGNLVSPKDIINVDMNGAFQQVFDLKGQGFEVSQGKQLAVRVDSVSAENPVVRVILSG